MGDDGMTVSAADLKVLSPSSFVRKFAATLVGSAQNLPILDVACGGGRNAIFLEHLGANVIGIDIDPNPARSIENRYFGTTFEAASRRFKFLQLDLIHDHWPFKEKSIGGIVNVHFLHTPLLDSFADSLIEGGYLILETVGGQGGNFRYLPRAGELKSAFQGKLSLLSYREQTAGPPEAAEFIYRNLTFAEHIALMGLEHTGYTPRNIDALWIDPYDYRDELQKAVEFLAVRGMNVSIYNHQLCTLNSSVWRYAKKSIADWKNSYLPDCQQCAVKKNCGGFFQWAARKHSNHISPITSELGTIA